jgi:hypothetical protein
MRQQAIRGVSEEWQQHILPTITYRDWSRPFDLSQHASFDVLWMASIEGRSGMGIGM